MSFVSKFNIVHGSTALHRKMATQTASGGILAKLFVFFLKAGSLTFGSGLVIVPFLEKGLVQETGSPGLAVGFGSRHRGEAVLRRSVR